MNSYKSDGQLRDEKIRNLEFKLERLVEEVEKLKRLLARR